MQPLITLCADLFYKSSIKTMQMLDLRVLVNFILLLIC